MHMGGFPTLAILVFFCNDVGFPPFNYRKIVLITSLAKWNNKHSFSAKRIPSMGKLIRIQISALFLSSFFMLFMPSLLQMKAWTEHTGSVRSVHKSALRVPMSYGSLPQGINPSCDDELQGNSLYILVKIINLCKIKVAPFRVPPSLWTEHFYFVWLVQIRLPDDG